MDETDEVQAAMQRIFTQKETGQIVQSCLLYFDGFYRGVEKAGKAIVDP
jgi:hypothetical protein